MRCTVLGSGTWGTALGQVLADNGNNVTIYGIDNNEVNDININHKNSKYFGDEVILPNLITATTDLKEALKETELVIVAVPSNAYRNVLNLVLPLLDKKIHIVSVAKGFDPVTLKRMSEVVRDVIPSEYRYEVVSLIGPGHAEEVILRMLTCITSTCLDEEEAKFIQKIFSNKYFRVYVQTDEIGAELGVSIKNAIAIASGMLIGIGMGDNAKAALVTRGLVEMIRYGVSEGGKESTFMGLTGVGDLIVTCNSIHSRNFQAGLEIGKDDSSKHFLQTNTKTVEGIRTAKIIHELAKEKNIEMPIIEAVYQVLYEDKKPSEIAYKLMTRELKNE